MTPPVSALAAAAVSVSVFVPPQVSFSFWALCARMHGAQEEEDMVTSCRNRETASASAVVSGTFTRT